MAKLIQLYENILDYCSMKPNTKGEVNISFVFDDGGDVSPAMLEGRQLVMPIDEQFKKYDPDKVIVFHPLQEYVNRGESEVVKALRYQLNVRINYTVLVVASALLELVGSPALHKNLTPEQRELLLQVPGAELTSAARFMEFAVKRFSDASSRFFTNIYLKKAGTYQGQKHARVGVVQFPIYELLKSGEVKFKKNDEETFRSILNFMFPGSMDEVEAYNSFSDHRDAPWLDCLLKTSYNLAQRLNDLIRLYKPYIEDAEKYLFNEDWVDELDNIEAYRAEIRRIPSQKGNEGTIEKEGKQDQTVLAQRPVPAPVEKSQPLQQPMPPGPPLVQQQPFYQQPQMPQYPQQYQQPAMQPQMYQQPPMQQPMPTTLQTTESGKLDFKSIEATNPMVAAAGMVSTPITQWQQAQQQMQQRPQFVDPRTGMVYQQPGGMPQQMQMDAWGRPVAPMQQQYPQQMMQPGMAYPQQMMMQQPMVDQYGRPIQQYPGVPVGNI